MGPRDGAGAGEGWVSFGRAWREAGVSAGSGDAGGEQLGEVVGGAHQRPLGLDLGEAAQEELAATAGMLDLADHRLDRLLAQAVARAPAGALEPRGHLGHQAVGLDLPLAARISAAVAGPARCQVAPDAAGGEPFEVALATEAGIGRDLAGLATERGRGGVEQRGEAGLVAAVGGQALGDDDLMRGKPALGPAQPDPWDCELAVGPLDEAVPGLEHAAVGVGEFALRPRRRPAVVGARWPTMVCHARGGAGLG